MIVREDDKEAEKGRIGNKWRRRLGKNGREREERKRKGKEEREKREKYDIPFQQQHSLVRLYLLIDHSAI